MNLIDLAERPLAQAPKRRSRLDKVAEYFRAHPHEWINAQKVFVKMAGFGGWRTRISECRTDLGMRIDNRQRHVTDPETQETFTVSEYRWVP